MEREVDEITAIQVQHLGFLTLCVSWMILANKYLSRHRRFWVKMVNQRRSTHGEFQLYLELRGDEAECKEQHFEYVRMSRSTLDELMRLLRPHLRAKRLYHNILRPNVSHLEMVVVTLRYLVTGCSQRHLAFSFRLGRSTVHYIIRHVSVAIWNCLHPLYVRAPTAAGQWMGIARDFERQWNMPHCVGAIDGKHVAIQNRSNSGSMFYNYKGFHSIVLLAACDSYYRFTYVDIGDYGRQSDGGVFSRSSMGQGLIDDALNLPRRAPLLGVSTPYYFVGDDAFPLKENLMKPYPGRSLTHERRVYNYR